MASLDPRTPNLFIVGAPKSGTTAIVEHLRRHADVAMSRPKELHFFGRASTQDDGNRFFEKRVGRRHSLQAYLSLWDGCEDRTWRGEGSTWYLYLPGAAQEIKAFSPDAHHHHPARPGGPGPRDPQPVAQPQRQRDHP